MDKNKPVWVRYFVNGFWYNISYNEYLDKIKTGVIFYETTQTVILKSRLPQPTILKQIL